MPGALPLAEAFIARLNTEQEGFSVRMQKTQITFSNRYNFAAISLLRMAGRAGIYIVVSFGLDHEERNPRIVTAVEPWPNRWTHHVVVRDPGEIDDELMRWIREAYDFSARK